MTGVGQTAPPSFVAATAELASIADAAEAWRPAFKRPGSGSTYPSLAATRSEHALVRALPPSTERRWRRVGLRVLAGPIQP